MYKIATLLALFSLQTAFCENQIAHLGFSDKENAYCIEYLVPDDWQISYADDRTTISSRDGTKKITYFYYYFPAQRKIKNLLDKGLKCSLEDLYDFECPSHIATSYFLDADPPYACYAFVQRDEEGEDNLCIINMANLTDFYDKNKNRLVFIKVFEANSEKTMADPIFAEINNSGLLYRLDDG